MGQTNIRYTDESINTAFSAFYVIPEYQREYVWEKTQVKQLMEDLLDAYTSDKNKAYFLGTIVTCSANGDFELVDGQQRLTTFFIILCIVKSCTRSTASRRHLSTSSSAERASTSTAFLLRGIGWSFSTRTSQTALS